MTVKDFTPETEIRRHLWIRGRVQGVGFRASTQREAQRLGGLLGFVRNLDDGCVEAVIQGPAQSVLALVAWCRQGPPAAEVQLLEVREERPEAGLTPFGVSR